MVVQDDIYDRFVSALADAMRSIRPGPGMDGASGLGPLIDVTNRERIRALVEGAPDASCMVLVRGEVPGGDLARGAFIAPSLIAADDLASPLVQNERFGPVMVVERFRDEDDAVWRANATRYGLAASVWSGDAGKARRVAGRMRAGSVWINAHNKLFAEIETGGERDSGYGRLHGVERMNDFLVTKHVYQSNLG